MKIIKKLGGYKNVIDILLAGGWKVRQPYGSLVLQCHRKSLSKEVSLIIYNYCLTHNIAVSISDFKGA